MVQTIESTITRMSMDQEAEWDEVLPVVMNAIHAKRSKEKYSPYGMIFAASPKSVLSPTMKLVEVFFPSSEEVHRDAGSDSRIMKLLAIQPRRLERCSKDLQTQTNPYNIDDIVIVRKLPHICKVALTAKWMGPWRDLEIQGTRCCSRQEKEKACETVFMCTESGRLGNDHNVLTNMWRLKSAVILSGARKGSSSRRENR